jgi:hypothetical protein
MANDKQSKVLPLTDQWSTNFNAYCGADVDGNYGITGAAGDDFVIASYGRAGVLEILPSVLPTQKLECMWSASQPISTVI